ncbi:MAG: hypothetical protein ACRDCN_12100 [Tannerellaceae bacterium]
MRLIKHIVVFGIIFLSIVALIKRCSRSIEYPNFVEREAPLEIPERKDLLYYSHKSIYEINGNEILIIDPRVDSVWHSNIRYVISIPNNPSFIDCCNLLDLLVRQDVYTKENTIVFCTEANKNNVEEVAPDFTKCIMATVLSGANKRAITYYVIEKKKSGRFEYVLKRIR